VIKKFGEDSSGNLAVLIAYYAFFSIFPLLLALFSILGFFLAGHPDWQASIENGALSNFRHLPLIGDGPVPTKGNVTVVVIASLVALYSGLAVAKTAQTVWDTIYRVPKAEQPGFAPRIVRALRLVIVGGLGLIATTVFAGNIATTGEFGLDLGYGATIAGWVITLVLNTLLFTLIFRWLTVREVSFREALPGATLCAAVFLALAIIVPTFISRQLGTAQAHYGRDVAGVLVLLSWFYLQAQVLVFSGQLNVVKHDHLWPRSMDEAPPEVSALGEPMPAPDEAEPS
jgi:membrane protein